MIKKENQQITETKSIVTSIICDKCGRELNDDIFERQEAFHYRTTGGYGSVWGDGDGFEIDLCQHCLKELLGKYGKHIKE